MEFYHIICIIYLTCYVIQRKRVPSSLPQIQLFPSVSWVKLAVSLLIMQSVAGHNRRDQCFVGFQHWASAADILVRPAKTLSEFSETGIWVFWLSSFWGGNY